MVQRLRIFQHPPKASFALLISPNSLGKALFVKIRPKGVAKIEFSISNLPQQKIAYTLLTACANKQVRGGGAWLIIKQLARSSSV